jgi:hypothetical protein
VDDERAARELSAALSELQAESTAVPAANTGIENLRIRKTPRPIADLLVGAGRSK